MPDKPALASADKDDVISGGHAGDEAVAFCTVPLKEVDGKSVAARVHLAELSEPAGTLEG